MNRRDMKEIGVALADRTQMEKKIENTRKGKMRLFFNL
jgi:hypothetical protein